MSNLPKFRVFVSNACQLSCAFCGGNKGDMESFQPEDLTYECSKENILNIICAYAKCGGKDVQLTGGEPLLNKDIVEIVASIHRLGIRAEINTNGIALTEEMSIQLKRAGLKSIKISMPAFDREGYKKVTLNDYFETVCKNISIASKYFDVRINTVATKELMKELPQIIEFCKNTGIKNLALLELCYYPNLITKDYFQEEHVDFVNDYMVKMQQQFSRIEKIPSRKDFVTPVYYIIDPQDGFCISYKCANPVYRCKNCDKCKSFCQEGLYQLRLSSGGYLNFCNFETELGLRLDSYMNNQEALENAFRQVSSVWDNIYEGDPNEFYLKMGLELT